MNPKRGRERRKSDGDWKLQPIFTATVDENCQNRIKFCTSMQNFMDSTAMAATTTTKLNYTNERIKSVAIHSFTYSTNRSARYDVYVENPVSENFWPKFICSFIHTTICLSCTLHHPPRHFYSSNEFWLYTFFVCSLDWCVLCGMCIS